jgi:hypothetical protein
MNLKLFIEAVIIAEDKSDRKMNMSGDRDGFARKQL